MTLDLARRVKEGDDEVAGGQRGRGTRAEKVAETATRSKKVAGTVTRLEVVGEWWRRCCC